VLGLFLVRPSTDRDRLDGKFKHSVNPRPPPLNVLLSLAARVDLEALFAPRPQEESQSALRSIRNL
jgi:hypothetical protein